MNGIVIEDCGQCVKNERDFLGDVRELYATTVVQRQLRELQVPVCAILAGALSGLATVVALAADYRFGYDNVCFDFAATEVATLVFDVADSTPSKSVILKIDLLLVFQKQRFCLDTKSKCQYDSEDPTSKTVILKMT